jgi:cytochrome c556
MPEAPMRLILALACLFAACAAQAQSVRPEQAIEYRQAVYQVILWNFQPLSAMARGRMDFDRALFRKHALRVANLSGHLLEGYPEGSEQGAETAALAKIWANWADFQTRMGDFQRESRQLANMSRASDFTELKDQFAEVSGTCKACHDLYKAD